MDARTHAHNADAVLIAATSVPERCYEQANMYNLAAIAEALTAIALHMTAEQEDDLT